MAGGLLAGLGALIMAACGAGAAVAPTVAPATATPRAAPVVAPDGPMVGPLVGFYIEDSYMDVYLSLYDAGAGGLHVLQSGTPIAVGEAQWFDSCHLFVHGQLLDMQGVPQWTMPEEAAAQINDVNVVRLSPDRQYAAYVIASDGQAGAAGADVEVVELSPPFATHRLTARGGGNSRALAWAADGAWLTFTDLDDSGVAQLYRAAPGEWAVEQLTHHAGPVGAINALAPSPDGRYLAYSVQTLLQATHPYLYHPKDEGWVSILGLETGAVAEVRPEKFHSAEPGSGLVWSAGGEQLLIIGDSLPVAAEDPAAGRQVHWVTPDGAITHSLRTADAPEGHIGWVAPLGDIGRLLVNVRDGFYLYDGQLRPLDPGLAPPPGMDVGRRAVGILPAPVGGIAECD